MNDYPLGTIIEISDCPQSPNSVGRFEVVEHIEGWRHHWVKLRMAGGHERFRLYLKSFVDRYGEIAVARGRVT